jgi:hypothetical protein
MEIDIKSGISAVLGPKKKTYPQHVNRISALDDPCNRRLYYARHDWDKATKNDDALQGVFETGTILEPVIERIVSEVGMASTPQWRIVGTQTTTNDKLLKEYQISGTIDGFLQIKSDGQWITEGVVDIKTMSTNIYPQINSYADLVKYPWTKRYRGQLMIYALSHNLENCFILAVNKNNLFDMKIIEFAVDMQYCEELLQKAALVNEAVKTNTPPAGINHPKECPKCKFYAICAPDITTGGNLQMIDDPELETLLNQIAELEPSADRYDELCKERDALLVQGKDVVCGHWIVQWKKLEKNFKPQPAKDGCVKVEWRKTITQVA